MKGYILIQFNEKQTTLQWNEIVCNKNIPTHWSKILKNVDFCVKVKILYIINKFIYTFIKQWVSKNRQTFSAKLKQQSLTPFSAYLIDSHFMWLLKYSIHLIPWCRCSQSSICLLAVKLVFSISCVRSGQTTENQKYFT